ncbi:FAD-binding domain-containing protein [Eremomyces bilateralis CBS 781.70]|uniref:FAD-binding domain-containing protein n=1 Tax=Eremomyces bilateralis CBS 781.70 TaxID=1392243 RepID=A0A6G1FWH9_9PEZI|nr:FAD-binding domain-containing protein [Eremomyces bilateralis CBS 781.70]KAF1810088.1 FAD-binding domain-containing protein [Eremomyces bilateralis CBS 781.70]
MKLPSAAGLLLAALTGVVNGQGQTLAKNYEGNAGFPTSAQWDALNSAVGNKLSRCGSGRLEACTSEDTPSYVLRARNGQDIGNALKFANEHNLRVTVRGTGHDFMERNTGAGSLNIWTTDMRGAQWTASWAPSNGSAPNGPKLAAVTIGAGMAWTSVTSTVERNGHVVTTGADTTVGAAGGWTMGGGHGPLSNQYGMGCDNLLEAVVALPSGDIVTANANSYPDLYWAIRGGGGGTFGVMISATMRTYPKPTMNGLTLRISGRGSGYVNALAYMWAKLPEITDFGLSGYPTMSSSSYFGMLNAPGKTTAEINAFFNPIAAKMRSYGATVSASASSGGLLGGLLGGFGGLGRRSFYETYGEPTNQRVKRQALTSVGLFSSRLIARSAMNEENLPAIRKMLETILATSRVSVLPYPNSGGQVARNAELDVGLNPAWRESVMHMIVQRMDAKAAVAAMGPLSANEGAYLNEAYPEEVDWKRTFFGGGEHYEKLLAVKNKYDPKNTLWCMPCVGGDVFVEGKDGRLYNP